MALALVRIVIVEDQSTIRKDMQALITEQHGFIVVGACGSVEAAKTIIPATQPDLLLLDVSLEDGTAFDLLQEFPAPNFKVIFLTAYPDHAIQAIKYGALDYLLKPVDKNELYQALSKGVNLLPPKPEQLAIAEQHYRGHDKHKHIVLRSADYLQIVELKDIVYCMSDSGYTTFFLADGKKLMTSRYLKEYEDILTSASFIRPHQSYMVNLAYVDRYHHEGRLILKDGTEIIVATRRKDDIKEMINKL